MYNFEVIEDGFKKTTSKRGRPPIKPDDLPLLRTLWNDKQETDKSFFVDFEKIKNSSYKLFMNFYKPRKPIKNPKELGEICEEPILGGTPPRKDKEDNTITEYLYYILPLVNYMPYAQRASKGYTLNKDLIPTVEVPFPDGEKRKKIIEEFKKLIKKLNEEKERREKEVNKRKENLNKFKEKIFNI